MRITPVAAAVAVLLLLPAPAQAATAGSFQRVSAPAPFGGETDGGSGGGGAGRTVSVSADGRWVAFSSWSTTLTSDPADGFRHVYVRDTLLKRTVRASGPNATTSDDNREPAISGDGRYVAFASTSTALAPGGDEPGTYDVFVRDLRTGMITRVSSTPGGDAGDASSFAPDITPDGRYVAFQSYAGDLLPGENTGYHSNIFVRDLVTGVLAKIPSQGTAQSPSISADGRRVAYQAPSRTPSPVFQSDAVFLHDRNGGVTTEMSAGLYDTRYNMNANGHPVVSDDGRWVIWNFIGWWGNGTEEAANVYQWDVAAGTRRLVTADPQGRPSAVEQTGGWPDVSADGRYVVFNTVARLVADDRDALTDTYRWDRTTGRKLRITAGQVTSGRGSGFRAAVSASGNRVAFDNDAHAGLSPGTGPVHQLKVYLWAAS